MSEQAKGPINYNPNDLNAVLGGMNTELAGIKEQLKLINDKLDKHNERLSTLENFRYMLLGAAAIVSALSSYIISKFKGT